MSSFLEALGLLWQRASGRVVFVIALMLLVGLSEGVGLVMLVPMLALVGIDTGEGALGTVTQGVAQVFESVGLSPTLSSVLVIYVLIVGLRAVLVRAQELAGFALEQRFIAALREELFEGLLFAEWRGLLKRRNSDFSHVLIEELERLGDALGTALSLLVSLLTATVYLLLAFYVSLPMSLLILGCGLLVILPIQRKAQRVRQEGDAVSERYEALYASLSDALAGLKTTKSHGLEQMQSDVFAQLSQGLAKAHIAVGKNFEDVRFLTSLASVVILSVVLFVALRVFALTTASVLLMIFLFARLVPLLSRVQANYQALLADVPAAERVMPLREQLTRPAEMKCSLRPLDLRTSLRFDQVSFAYDGEPEVLKELSLELKAGEVTAVVGTSGAGKSTLADLVTGLLMPTKGRIYLDGAVLSAERRLNWRQSLGYVAQDTFMFHESLRDNLLRVRPEASEAELWRALELASARAFVEALPEKLDTLLGDRGIRLSGGERQRVALARALLRKPSLIILDEATSSLDAENEQRIQAAVEALQGEQTLLVITHRLSTVRRADAIYVLEQGRIVEAGSWPALLAQRGRFHALCKAQGLIQGLTL